MKARLWFHGAAQEVTGSMHLIQHNGRTVALDCGLFQGRRKEADAKNRSFPRPSGRIEAVVLSHAHVDHCGKLPRLVQAGFSGPIYATPATCDLARILLADSAHIQEEDAAYWNKKRVRRGDAPIQPLYTQEDVDNTVRLLQPKRLGETFDVAPDMRVTLHEAGHMLGSAGVLLEIANGRREPSVYGTDLPAGDPVGPAFQPVIGQPTGSKAGPTRAVVRIVFTGDLGRPGLAILRDPAPLPRCDYLICESTYGGRQTPGNEDMAEQLAAVINATVERGGKVIIPAFAVGRTQVIVYHFHRLVDEGRIPRHPPLIVDSPLAARATEVFRNHPEVYDLEASIWRRMTGDLFQCTGCEYTRSVEESKALHRRKEPMIIVSASGMCETGRILHHLKNNLEDHRNTILIVGYQAAYTLGRRLVEKQKQVRIFGEMYEVRAQVKVLNGFSAHANAAELADCTAPLAGLVRKAFLVHGEPDQAQTLAAAMRERGFAEVLIPQAGQVFEIG
ncbi:MAG: MBL fold metallo-hydrolase [Planctomycetota bacterium]